MPLPISQEERLRILQQVFNLFTEYGIDGISMDKVARHVGLSKATVYKYFKSKEEIVRAMVQELINNMDATRFTRDKGIDGVLESFSVMYFKVVLISLQSSSKFIADLKSKFPDIHAEYMASMDGVSSRFCEFYRSIAAAGYCKPVTVEIIVAQVSGTLPVIMDPQFSQENDNTIAEVLEEYYRLLLYQMLEEPYIAAASVNSTYLFIEELVRTMDDLFPRYRRRGERCE